VSAIGQNALSIHTDPNAIALPHWVKLIREGNTFKAQHSNDGRRWEDLERGDSIQPATNTWRAVAKIQIPANESVYVRLAASSTGLKRSRQRHGEIVKLLGYWHKHQADLITPGAGDCHQAGRESGHGQHRLGQGNTRTTRKTERDYSRIFQDSTLYALPHGFGRRKVLPGPEPCPRERSKNDASVGW
jgi:hypothetical protein